MKPIASYQIRKIYSIGNALGIVESGSHDDELHMLIDHETGKESVKELSYQEAAIVIRRLETMQIRCTPTRKPDSKKKYESVPGGMTADQQKKAWALMYELKKYDDNLETAPLGDRLCGIIRKELHVDCAPRQPFRWVDFANGHKLIEKLKRYVANAKRQAG